MSTTLTQANSEWSNRLPDERYNSLASIHAAAVEDQRLAAVTVIPDNDLHVTHEAGNIFLNGKSKRALLTNWSFGQLCREAGAPAGYMTSLPAPLAVECMNHGLSSNPSSENTVVLFKNTEIGLTARALTSERYTRIWNADITRRLVDLEKQGTWQPAPEAFDGSRGLYLGDRDMFVFMVDNNRRIFETGPEGGLSRGFFCWNSETGSRSFGIMSFLYEYVCGNHRVWGASNIKEFRIRHIGDADERGFAQFRAVLTAYADSSAEDDEAKIKTCREYKFGGTKDEVLDAVFGLRIPDLSQIMIAQGFDKALEHDEWYGDPKTAWGLAGGLTEIARDLPNADDRDRLDRAAARVMEIAF